jgi:hypothetical protein
MPDSQVPPIWGPAYDERDLDALLSGETGSTPAALQPVESTLAALRAAATRRELSDEAVARAAFRAFAPAALTTGPLATGPLTTAAPTTGPLPWTAGAEPAAVSSHTLVLPPADGRPRLAARHRHRRPAARSARKPRIAVTGVAAAALVAVALVAGALTGSIGELTSFGRQPAGASASASPTGQSPGSQGTLAKGASERPQSPKPTVSATPATPRPTADPHSLCREYFEYGGHPGPGGEAAWITLQGQLSKLAGGPSLGKIFGYCLRNGKGGWLPAGAPAGGPGMTGEPGTGNAGTGNAGTGNAGAGGQGNQPSGPGDQGQGAAPAAGLSPP